MSSSTGFKVSRRTIADREGPQTALPEHGDAERLRYMANTIRELGDSRSEYIDEISRLWRDAAEKFLAIGRYLRQAKERLRHGEFEAMIAADLPFGKHVAFQLKAIADAVDGGRVGQHELPSSYTTAYKLIEMKPETLARARNENLVRPNVTRREIIVFQKRLCEEAQGLRPRPELLAEESSALKRRIAELINQKEMAERRLAEIEREIAAAKQAKRTEEMAAA
jgi:hypothetical protein